MGVPKDHALRWRYYPPVISHQGLLPYGKIAFFYGSKWSINFVSKWGDASKIVYWKTMDRVGVWGTKLWDSPRHLIFQCQVGPGFRMALGRSADHGSQLDGDFRQCQAMVIHSDGYPWLIMLITRRWHWRRDNGGFPSISRIDSQSAGGMNFHLENDLIWNLGVRKHGIPPPSWSFQSHLE